ncbi:MAG: hypothetical protein ACLFN5_07195, partial [bacterium]
AMVEIGTNLGKNMAALITDMNQPLGRAVGNGLEMIQAIEILKGNGPRDLTELVCRLAAEMLVMASYAENAEEGYELARQSIDDGSAVAKLADIIEAQSGNSGVIDDYSLFPGAEVEEKLGAPEAGFVQEINAFKIGMAAKNLGAGRETLDSALDYGAGILLDKKIGDEVEKGEPLVRLCYNKHSGDDSPHCNPQEARRRVLDAYQIGSAKPEPRPLIYAKMDARGKIKKLNLKRPL